MRWSQNSCGCLNDGVRSVPAATEAGFKRHRALPLGLLILRVCLAGHCQDAAAELGFWGMLLPCCAAAGPEEEANKDGRKLKHWEESDLCACCCFPLAQLI